MNLLAFTLLTLAAVATAVVTNAADTPKEPEIGREVGQIFPRTVLPSLDGKRTLSVSSFRGKKVLLIEFAAW